MKHTALLVTHLQKVLIDPLYVSNIPKHGQKHGQNVSEMFVVHASGFMVKPASELST